MITRIVANRAIKEAQKSFEVCITMLLQYASICKDVKQYLTERGITKEYLTKKTEAKTLVCKAELFRYVKLYEFTSASGGTYKAIGRMDAKTKTIVEAKWTIWGVMCAIDKMYIAKQEAKTIREAVEGKKANAKAIEESEAKEEAKEKEREAIRKEVQSNREKKSTIASVKAAQKAKKSTKVA